MALPMLMFLIVGLTENVPKDEKGALPGFELSAFIDKKYQEDMENWFLGKNPFGSGKTANINASATIPVTVLESDMDEEPTEETTEEIKEPEKVMVGNIEPRFPEYVREWEALFDPDGYRGTEHVIIGKNGCLYENGYINEYYGLAPKYVNVTDAKLISRVEILKEIQDELESRGIAFCVAISPSKASAMADYIPDWYMEENKPLADDYVRPYTRFLKLLEENGVYHVDSTSLYKSLGMTNTFPKTGIHWNRLAAFETCVAIIAEYERQTGTEIKHLAADEIRFSKNPPASEQDIFGIVYSGKRKEREDAIIDEKYFWHDVYTSNKTKPSIPHMTIQGGSFTGDFYHFFGNYGIAEGMTGFYYNNGGNMKINWRGEIRKTKFVLLEVNEQFVYNMGGVSPAWGQSDIAILDLGNNIIDSLWEYLMDNPAD